MAVAKDELQAKAVQLRVMGRLGTNEIARQLGVSKGSVSRWLARLPRLQSLP